MSPRQHCCTISQATFVDISQHCSGCWLGVTDSVDLLVCFSGETHLAFICEWTVENARLTGEMIFTSSESCYWESNFSHALISYNEVYCYIAYLLTFRLWILSGRLANQTEDCLS